MQRVVRVAIKALATARTPRVFVVVFMAAARVASDEVHDPLAGGKVRIRRRRPRGGRLHSQEGMARGEGRRREARLARLHHGRQLLQQRQVKPFPAPTSRLAQ
jgi:hypothetical protein